MPNPLNISVSDAELVRAALVGMCQAHAVDASNTSSFLNAQKALTVLNNLLGDETVVPLSAVKEVSVPVHKEFQLLAMSDLFDFQEATGFDCAADFKDAVRSGTWAPPAL